MSNSIRIRVDNTEIEAPEGANLLQTCLDNNIYIPNLCFLKEMKIPPVSCGLCFVELEGEEEPVSGCTLKVREGMVVRTDTERVRKLQQTGLKLLLSTHLVDCWNCPANKRCEIQRLSKFLKVGLKNEDFEKKLKEPQVDKTHHLIYFYPNRCVLCGRCVHVCEMKGHYILSFVKRGLDTVISLYGLEEDLSCGGCKECIDVCPVKALEYYVGQQPERVDTKEKLQNRT